MKTNQRKIEISKSDAVFILTILKNLKETNKWRSDVQGSHVIRRLEKVLGE